MSRHGALRASDADRDQIVERLHRASTEGRIAPEELEQRLTAALRARTYAELEATVADLPRPGSHSRSRSRGELVRARTAGGWAVGAVRANPALVLFAIPVLAVATAMLLAATVLWSIIVLVVFVLGRHHGPPTPWAYGRRAIGHRRTPRVGPGRHWA